MSLQRYRVGITNFPGAPGVTTLYFGTGVTDFTGVKTFFDAIKANFPNGLTFTYPTTVDVINEATGQLTGSVVGTTLASTVSITTASVYSGVSGAIVRWNTGLIQNGKRKRSRTWSRLRTPRYSGNTSVWLPATWISEWRCKRCGTSLYGSLRTHVAVSRDQCDAILSRRPR